MRKYLGKDVYEMTVIKFQNYLKAHYPKENEACEWKCWIFKPYPLFSVKPHDTRSYRLSARSR